jgi:hypothetical protein
MKNEVCRGGFMKVLISLFLFLLSFNLFGAGMTTHMFMAEKSINYFEETGLKTLLNEEKDAFLSGSIFPDSGYFSKNSYGEYAHWSDFSNKYFNYIKNNCSFPFKGDCKKLFAHMLGCIAHTIGDVNWDRYFNNLAKDHDFNGNYGKADDALTIGIDFTIIMKQTNRIKFPKKFLPKEILYEFLKDETDDKKKLKKDLKYNPSLQRGLLFGERVIAAFGYLSVRRKAPWSVDNYMSAKGGVTDTAKIMANLFDTVWRSLRTRGLEKLPVFKSGGVWPNGVYYSVETD